MNSRFIRLCAGAVLASLLFSLGYQPVLAAAGRGRDDREVGYVKLETRYKNLRVFVNQAPIGRTPVEVLSLPAGVHRISVQHPSPASWFERDWVRDVEVLPGDTVVVRVVFKWAYKVDTQPFGADVYLNGAHIGRSPVFFALDEGATGWITIAKAGFADTSFAVAETSARYMRIVLQPKLPNWQARVTGVEPRDSARPGSKKLLYSAIGLTLVAGAAAAYFRKKGNDSYDRYLSSGNPQIFNRHYDEAKRFDRYAAVTFGAFQVSFVLSFYLFLQQVNR